MTNTQALDTNRQYMEHMEQRKKLDEEMNRLSNKLRDFCMSHPKCTNCVLYREGKCIRWDSCDTDE